MYDFHTLAKTLNLTILPKFYLKAKFIHRKKTPKGLFTNWSPVTKYIGSFLSQSTKCCRPHLDCRKATCLWFAVRYGSKTIYFLKTKPAVLQRLLVLFLPNCAVDGT